MTRHRLPSVLLLLVLFALPLAAQVDRGTSDLVATDETGATLPGVTVTVRSLETGAEHVEVTAPNDIARVLALPPGTYSVRAELSGFATITQEQLPLRVGQTARVNVVLRPAAQEAITVTAASEVVDVYKTDTSSNIVPEQIEMLPVADRDFQRLAFIAPGVQRERGAFRFINGGPVVGSSLNASQATILVDGVDYTDAALGLSRTRFSQDAVREFRVIQNRFDTEIGGSSGGALSIVTKSGTNEFSGTVFGFYRDDSLREPSATEIQEIPFNRQQYGFTFGGPLALDRTHFFASYENVDEDNVTLFRPLGTFATLAADIEHPFKQDLLFGSLDHIVSDAQALSMRAVFEKYREENFRVGGVSDVSAGQDLQRDNWNVSLGHTWTISQASLNELRAQVGHHKYYEPTNSDAVSEYLSLGATLITGSSIFGDMLGEGDFVELRDTFHTSLADGRHNLKAGLGIQLVEERLVMDLYPQGLFWWAPPSTALPNPRSFLFMYSYGVGSSDSTADTKIISGFVEDEYRPNPRLALNLGLRYDLDTDGNNADFEHPLKPNGSDVDTDNIQPRLGFTWDTRGDGSWVVRGGAGLFTGRFLLVPALTELQQNGVTGRRLLNRVSVPAFGLILDPNNPTTTGYQMPMDITLLAEDLEAPESTQASIGFTHRIGDTGLHFDADV
ncbi:MAG TPA: TonB-dependent receptor, partial [Thermoanaerobaculia bacterium]